MNESLGAARDGPGCLEQPNIELSCAAESPARSEPQRRHTFEQEDNFRRQLQRFVGRISLTNLRLL
jgi:hypothetical protein